MNYTALIVAAGSGSRMGLGYNKLLFRFDSGETIIERTVQIFEKDERCRQIVVVISEHDEEAMRPLLANRVQFVYGGEQRSDSVYNGLSAVNQETVLIHDGARPWLSKTSLDALLLKKETCRACLLMIPVKDTIKEVRDGVVIRTHERSALMQAQTPQAFDTAFLLSCYRRCMASGFSVTDDAQVVERCSDESVYAVLGDYENKKITTRDDLK